MPQLQINQGPQDALLYDNTRSYFTNVGYVRTSNFQMELRDVPPQNNAALGSTVHYVIPKSADLLGPIDLMVDFNDASPVSGSTATTMGNYAAWVDTLGYAMIDEMQFSIGSHVVETITGDQMNIINELMKGDSQRQGKNIGKTGRSAITLDVDEENTHVATSTIGAGAWHPHDLGSDSRIITSQENGSGSGGIKAKSLIVPLNFFFTKHPSQYFPLCAIAGCNDVRVTIKFRSLNELMIIGRHNYATTNSSTTVGLENAAVVETQTTLQTKVAGSDTTFVSPVPTFGNGGAIKKCELRCHYVHVTGPEATTLMNKEHVRLLKLWHHQPKTFKVDFNKTTKTDQHFELDLSFLHPVQELVVTIRKTSNMTSSTEFSSIPSDLDQKATCKNYFAYEGSGKDPNIESHLNKIPQRAHGVSPLDRSNIVNTLKVKDFKLSLNGQERHPSLAGDGISREYLMDRLMPMLHSNTSDTFIEAGMSDPGHDGSATFAHLGEMLDRKEIYVYPFALNPEGANPSGAVNFSKVSHAKLRIDYDAIRGAGAYASDVYTNDVSEEYVVDVYGVYFNWLQIKDGRALTSFQ